MISEEITWAIDELIQARLSLYNEENKNPSYTIQILNAKFRVKVAQHALTALVDNFKKS
jgi:hypothetical protein